MQYWKVFFTQHRSKDTWLKSVPSFRFIMLRVNVNITVSKCGLISHIHGYSGDSFSTFHYPVTKLLQYFSLFSRIFKTCILKFASWAFDGSALDIEIDPSETGVKEDIYQNNTEWEMMNVTVERKEVSVGYCSLPPEPLSGRTITM